MTNDSGLRSGVRWFVVLAQEQNVTAAAARLAIAQPTLSRMLARLERRIGMPLFDRAGRRIVLNEAGRMLAGHLQQADAAIVAGESALAALSGAAAEPIRLGFLHSFGTWLVPELIRLQRDALPGTAFRLSQSAADAVTAGVQQGSIDVGIVSPRPTATGLSWRRLSYQPLRLAVPDTHPLARRPSVGFGELTTEAFVSMAPGFGMRAILDEWCEAAGFVPRIDVECQELATVAALVGAGLGIALLPVDEVPMPPGVALIAVQGADAQREIGVIWRGRPAPQIRGFIDRAVGWAARR